MSNSDNPLYSSILSIFIINDNETIALEVNRKNDECEFHRLEMNASVFDVFPSGTLIVKDNNDIISKIATRKINKVKLVFQNDSPRYYTIHSVNNINNYASSTENPYVGIYFSNDFYTYCQENTLSNIAALQKPKVFKIDELVKAISGNDYQTIDTTSNYACFRPFNPKMDGTEIATDNVAEYVNYLSSLALSDVEMIGQPRFLFWTDWTDGRLVNFHFVKKIENYPIVARYKIYSDDSAARGNLRKIYSYTANQALQYITREYYYIRKTPKILDLPKPGDNVYEQLAYQFLDDGQKYNIEIVGSNGTLNSVPRGAEEISPETPWGYFAGNHSSSINSPPTHANQQYGYSSTYKSFQFGDSSVSGAYEFLDNPEMWKNVFDLTPIHPDYPGNGLIPGDSTNLQKVLDIKFSAQEIEAAGNNTQLKKIREIELQNFILYALCCMGDSAEDESFFAKLTKAIDAGAYGELTNRKWFYEWKQIVFNPSLEEPQGEPGSGEPQGEPGSGEPQGLEYSAEWYLLGNSGFWKDGPDNFQISGYAVNLNETGNTGDSGYGDSFIQPGWKKLTYDQTSPLREMKYRPIGSKSDTTGQHTPEKPIYAIVKMYKKSWEKLLLEGGYTGSIPQEINGKYFVYFSAENVVDGDCVA